MRNKHSFHYVSKYGIIVNRIMLLLKSTFVGWIQRANPKHHDVIEAAVPHLSRAVSAVF